MSRREQAILGVLFVLFLTGPLVTGLKMLGWITLSASASFEISLFLNLSKAACVVWLIRTMISRVYITTQSTTRTLTVAACAVNLHRQLGQRIAADRLETTVRPDYPPTVNHHHSISVPGHNS